MELGSIQEHIDLLKSHCRVGHPSVDDDDGGEDGDDGDGDDDDAV